MIVVKFFQSFQSSGPLFFNQERVGLGETLLQFGNFDP